mmetsp:Transcript_11609/g.27268  ORF Transcript_11609/g.27268 Transcript_11609/m.27268 type:complete len:243 (+) Transcript_11609:517-1245(+)
MPFEIASAMSARLTLTYSIGRSRWRLQTPISFLERRSNPGLSLMTNPSADGFRSASGFPWPPGGGFVGPSAAAGFLSPSRSVGAASCPAGAFPAPFSGGAPAAPPFAAPPPEASGGGANCLHISADGLAARFPGRGAFLSSPPSPDFLPFFLSFSFLSHASLCRTRRDLSSSYRSQSESLLIPMRWYVSSFAISFLRRFASSVFLTKASCSSREWYRAKSLILCTRWRSSGSMSHIFSWFSL